MPLPIALPFSTIGRGDFFDMKNPTYKKLSKAEKETAVHGREILLDRMYTGYFRVFCIVVGFVFLIKGIVGIIWRTLH